MRLSRMLQVVSIAVVTVTNSFAATAFQKQQKIDEGSRSSIDAAINERTNPQQRESLSLPGSNEQFIRQEMTLTGGADSTIQGNKAESKELIKIGNSQETGGLVVVTAQNKNEVGNNAAMLLSKGMNIGDGLVRFKGTVDDFDNLKLDAPKTAQAIIDYANKGQGPNAAEVKQFLNEKSGSGARLSFWVSGNGQIAVMGVEKGKGTSPYKDAYASAGLPAGKIMAGPPATNFGVTDSRASAIKERADTTNTSPVKVTPVPPAVVRTEGVPTSPAIAPESPAATSVKYEQPRAGLPQYMTITVAPNTATRVYDTVPRQSMIVGPSKSLDVKVEVFNDNRGIQVRISGLSQSNFKNVFSPNQTYSVVDQSGKHPAAFQFHIPEEMLRGI